MRGSRDLFASLTLFAALVGLAAFLGTRQTASPESRPSLPFYSTRSAGNSGTVALALWLEAMGYRIQRLEDPTFDVPANAKALFIFPNQYGGLGVPLTDGDVKAIMAWTQRGNTLIVSGDSALDTNRLGTALLAKSRRLKSPAHRLALEQPLAGDLNSDISVEATYALDLNRTDYARYLGAEDLPVLATFSEGQGRVWLTSAPDLFTNANLRNDANAALVGALVSSVPRGSLIAFDEYHLGIKAPSAATDAGLSTLLFDTPAGWATLYGLLVILVFLFLSGQRLGRPIPLRETRIRRRPAEYVVAMAHLFRRAHKRNMARAYYHDWLKRRLARPHGLSPDLPDDDFVAALARVSEQTDAAALSRLLHALDRPRVSDKELIKLANQAVQFSGPQG